MRKTILIKKTGAGRRPRKQVAVIGSRAAILTAARGVFAQKGFEGTSTREVAEAAGVNNAMIYYHFSDKRELYRAVLLDSFSALERIWESEIFKSDATVREQIAFYIDQLVRFHHANDDLRRIIFRELNVCSENCRWIADNMFRNTYKKMFALLQEGIKTGEIRPCDPAMAIPAIFGIVAHVFMSQPVAEYLSGAKMLMNVPDLGLFVTDLFFDGLGTSQSGTKRKKK